MTVSKRLTVTVAVIALAAGVAGTLAFERAGNWSPLAGAPPTRNSATCTFSRPANAPKVAPPLPVEVCVEPIPISPGDDLLRSALSALVGGLLGVGTFVAGLFVVQRRRREVARAAVTLVIQELQTDWAAMDRALNPAPPGQTAPEEKVAASLLRQVGLMLGESLPPNIVAATFTLYGKLGDLEGKDLRVEPQPTVRRLRDDTQLVVDKLSPYGNRV